MHTHAIAVSDRQTGAQADRCGHLAVVVMLLNVARWRGREAGVQRLQGRQVGSEICEVGAPLLQQPQLQLAVLIIGAHSPVLAHDVVPGGQRFDEYMIEICVIHVMSQQSLRHMLNLHTILQCSCGMD